MFPIFGVAKVVYQDLGDLIWNLAIYPVQSLVDTVREKSLHPKKSFQCWLKAFSFQTNLRKKARKKTSKKNMLQLIVHIPYLFWGLFNETSVWLILEAEVGFNIA